MHIDFFSRPAVVSLGAAFLLSALPSTLAAQVTQHYTETPLTSNQASAAPVRDANLVNPWGLSRSSAGAWWVSDNGTGLSTLYGGTGNIVPLVVPVPSGDPTVSTTGTPTGTIFNGDITIFPIAPGKAASFLFATEDGTISGWNPTVSKSAIIVVNNKQKSVYKGLTSASATVNGFTQTYLYAADFRQGKVAVFDSSFTPVNLTIDKDGDGDRRREDRRIPAFQNNWLPWGYAPFNVQNIGGNIYVTYAKQDTAKHDEVDGAGLGYVSVFTPNGKLLMNLEHNAAMNAPWGIAQAPSDFGAYSHDILVGQFGSGEILAYDPITGQYKGALQGSNDTPLVIGGLWAIAFGNGAGAGPATSLYFTAGPNQEQNGLFGVITAVENARGNDI